MKYSQCLALILALMLVSSATGWSQAPPEDWLKPYKTQVTRDVAGLATIQKSLAVMNPPSLPGITDASLEFNVSEWEGKSATGTCQETLIGMFSQSRSVVIDGSVVDHTVLKGGVRSSQLADGGATSVNDRRAFEAIPLLPPVLLQEVLINPLDEIQSLPDDSNAPNQTIVRVTVRPATWNPKTRDLESASFDLYFDNGTQLLNKVLGVIHADGNPRHSILHEVVYSQYQAIQSLMLPQSIEERLIGKSMNIFSVKSIAINQGLSLSSLN